MFENVTFNEILLCCAIAVFIMLLILATARSIINYSYERKEKHLKLVSGAIAAGLEAMTKGKKDKEAEKDIQKTE